MNPANTAIVISWNLRRANDNTRENVVIPIAAPAINTNITGTLNVLTASMIYKYFPSNTKIKLPEIPGKIMAQMAIAPQRKIKSKLLGVSAGVATVI